MYLTNEKPIIRSNLCYYDCEYTRNLGRDVQQILGKYGFFPPDKIYADSLTKGKYIKYHDNLIDFMDLAYTKKGILGISMASGDSRIVSDYWAFDWYFTFYKNEKLAVNKPKFVPWNVLSLDTTYGRIKNDEEHSKYLACIAELIVLIKPFHARIDDVSNAVALLKKTGESCFTPDHIQQVYWGNYWDLDHYSTLDKESLLQIPDCCVQELGNGVFLTLTDCVLDATTSRCNQNRKNVKKCIGLC